ncbi:hypothetical protein PHLGIDRAFT_105456 [Phlebiopsis gigantea 11061_1 CR5-6]|uniref:NADP-dependent oxidoreductase domain-containing protein n=1 Tax=Phlebiopsis gigantea (strain 11061_1 CR5-6) TaxID=745531 RepID=A0A0C3S8P7_PHLG1|nr:hypothetical protein PHLGIDRAFT_105456 [Phlebiopsis gigantea 11061_1 CR5-6]
MPPAPIAEPSSPLARYRRLSPRSGIFVSPLQLGTMSLGSRWAAVGTTTKEAAFAYLDAFFEAGGNFIDTANFYQDGETEEWIGEWMESRQNRDQIVLATKYSGAWAAGDPSVKQQAGLIGNCTKSMKLSLEASLRKLRTSYVDILYVHWWDWTTTIEDVMDGLHVLITQGKVLHIGASNTPAWLVAKGNQYARDHGRPPFVIYQGEWNVMCRDVERDILPLCRNDGMAFAPWNMFCSGRLRTDAEEAERERAGEHGRVRNAPDWKRTDLERRVSGVLEAIADEVGAGDIRRVLVAYHLQKQPHVFPILGGRKLEQLHSNLAALAVGLSDEHIRRIEEAVPFDVGFPHRYVGDGSQPEPNNASRIWIDQDPMPAAIRPPLRQ